MRVIKQIYETSNVFWNFIAKSRWDISKDNIIIIVNIMF